MCGGGGGGKWGQSRWDSALKDCFNNRVAVNLVQYEATLQSSFNNINSQILNIQAHFPILDSKTLPPNHRAKEFKEQQEEEKLSLPPPIEG